MKIVHVVFHTTNYVRVNRDVMNRDLRLFTQYQLTTIVLVVNAWKHTELPFLRHHNSSLLVLLYCIWLVFVFIAFVPVCTVADLGGGWPFFFFFFGDHLILDEKIVWISDFGRKIALNFGEDIRMFEVLCLKSPPPKFSGSATVFLSYVTALITANNFFVAALSVPGLCFVCPMLTVTHSELFWYRYMLIYLKFIPDTPTVAMSFYYSLDFIWDFGLQILTRLLASLHIGDKQVDAYYVITCVVQVGS